MDQSTTRRTPRDVWLTVGLAIAEGLPAPRAVELLESRIVRVSVETHADAAAWATRLGLAGTLRTQILVSSELLHNYYGQREGWSWTVRSVERPSTVDKIVDPDAAQILRAALAEGTS